MIDAVIHDVGKSISMKGGGVQRWKADGVVVWKFGWKI
jgi:hypothetical protein